MAKKQDLIARLIAEVEPRHPLPTEPKEGLTLLEQGLVLVLMRHLTQLQAEASVVALRTAMEDWNVVRVSQVQEIAQHLKTSSRKKGFDLLNDRKQAAHAVKAYLQDVFQQTHGLELEFLKEDLAQAGKVITSLQELGLTGGAYLMYVGTDGQVPVHMALVRMLDKLGWITRTTSLPKATAAIEGLITKGQELGFTIAMHEVMDRWNDEEEPIFATVKVLREVPYGKKAYTDWEASRKRAKAQAEKEEARRIANEKREADRLRKEEAKERKRLEAEEKRRQQKEERDRKAAERAAVAAKKKAEATKKKEQEAKKKAAEKAKAEAAKKKAAEKAKAASKKKATKAPAKKAATKKTASKKAAKKPAAKKAAKKATPKTAPKKAAKKATRKTTPKKAAKKATKKKATARKTARKR